MDAQDRQTQVDSVPYPNLPPLIDSRATEYRGPGITSTVAIFGHPIHPIIVIFPVAFLSAAAGSDLGYLLTQDFFGLGLGFGCWGLGYCLGSPLV